MVNGTQCSHYTVYNTKQHSQQVNNASSSWIQSSSLNSIRWRTNWWYELRSIHTHRTHNSNRAFENMALVSGQKVKCIFSLAQFVCIGRSVTVQPQHHDKCTKFKSILLELILNVCMCAAACVQTIKFHFSLACVVIESSEYCCHFGCCSTTLGNCLPGKSHFQLFAQINSTVSPANVVKWLSKASPSCFVVVVGLFVPQIGRISNR